MATIVLHGHDMSGPTSAFPVDADPGQPFYNTTTGQFYVYNGTAWQQCSVVPTVASQFVTSPILNCTGNPGDITGADDNYLKLTARGANNFYTTRTAAQLFSDISGNQVGYGCAISIIAGGTGTVTIIPGAGVTASADSVLTIPAGTLRQFTLTFTSTTTAILQDVGSGPWP